MKNIKTILCASLLAVAMSSSALAGTISTTRAGTISTSHFGDTSCQRSFNLARKPLTKHSHDDVGKGYAKKTESSSPTQEAQLKVQLNGD